MPRSCELFVLSLSVWLLSYPAYAAISVEPEALVISTTEHRGITRTLSLSSDVDIRRLAIAVSDLQRTDNAAIIPSRAFTPELPPTPLRAGELVQVPIRLDAAQMDANGEFTGSLWITYDGIQQTLPITLRVKAPIGLPLMILLAGVALGSILSWYRTRGLPQDELVVRMGRLRTQMRADADLAESGRRFRRRIEGHLIDSETALGNRVWEIATVSLDQAEGVWTRWRKGREDWISQLNYLQMLLEQVKQPPLKQTTYGEKVQAQLDSIERRSADFETPQMFQDDLTPQRDAINRYREGELLMEQMARIETRLQDNTHRDHWATERAQLQAQLQNLDPMTPEAFEQWKLHSEEQQQSMIQEIQQQQEMVSRDISREPATRDISSRLPQSLPLIPGVGTLAEEVAVRSARSRLRVFRLVSQGVAIAFLSWAGLSELYEGNPVFGAVPVSDYLALVAWGFGAEVTRDSIVKAVQELSGNTRNEDKST